MKSIRRTLLLNVLLLLVVTLGVVSYFVYRTAERALRERQRTARELIQVRYDDRQDESLRNRAEELAGEVQSNFNHDQFRRQWIASEFSAVAPQILPSFATMTVRAATATGPVAFEYNARLATELRLNEEDLYREPGPAAYEYVQITSDAGNSWTSRSLSGHQLAPEEGKDSDARSRLDSLKLPDGTEVRRVVVKHPVTRYSHVGTFWVQRSPRREDGVSPLRAVVGLAGAARADRRGGQGRTTFGPPPPPPSLNPGGYALPNFYLHCAWSTGPDNPRLAPLIADRDEQLAEIDLDTERSVRSLRSTLAWSVAGAIVVTLLGGWFLVGLGLFPLQRLSFAVSEITSRDLRLPLDPKSLPSEVHLVAQRLSQSLVELQAAFDREKRAAADISHELRTPLAALTTTIEVACRKVRTAEQYKQTLEDCRGIAKQMSTLVERMLTLAWIDAGSDQLHLEQVHVDNLVGGVAAIGKPLAEVQGLTFRVNVPGQLMVRTDPDKLREVVMNLIHNAIEYNRPGGEVELSAAASPKGGVFVEVRDTGIGMSPETQAKIFERFFRGDPSRQATGVHAGLGLAIVKEYVDRLGGHLTVDSAIGTGSRFRIDLPNAS